MAADHRVNAAHVDPVAELRRLTTSCDGMAGVGYFNWVRDRPSRPGRARHRSLLDIAAMADH